MAQYAASTHQVEPFTQVPNYYLDSIKPNLTSTEADLCGVVIRQTIGWHRRSARISIGTFMAKTGRSRRAIITAKGALVDSGLLVLLEEGGGRTTSRYMLNLYYDRVEKADVEDIVDILTVVPTEPEEVAPQSSLDLTTQDAISSSEEPTSPSTSSIDDTTATLDSTIPPIVEECQDPDDTPNVVSPPVADVPIKEGAPTSDSTMPSEPVTTVADMHSRGAENAPLPSKDLDLSIINLNKKHTEAATSTTTSNVSKQSISTLRCMFSNLFPETEGKNNWGFWGYLAKTYGVAKCIEKINYMGEHRRRNPISNPQGFLRRALQCDYQPPKIVLQKIKADESAKRTIERSRKKAQERKTMIQNYNYEAATAALSQLIETLN